MSAAKRPFVGRLAVALALVAVGSGVVGLQVLAPRATAQQAQDAQAFVELPASDSLPPDLLAMRETKVPPTPPGRPSVQELEEVIKKQPGGPELLEKVKRGEKLDTLPATDSLPPDLKSMKQQKAPPASPGRPTIHELEEVIRQQPGGAERLEKAKQGIRPPKAPRGHSSLEYLRSIFASLNPFQARVANAGQTLTLALKPTVGTNGMHAGLEATSPVAARAWVIGATVRSFTPTNTLITGYRNYVFDWGAGCSLGSLKTVSQNPYVGLGVDIPTYGNYIVSARIAAPWGVHLYHYENGYHRLLTRFNCYLRSGVYSDLPVVVYLAPGMHYFYWVVEGTTSAEALFQCVTVDSYP